MYHVATERHGAQRFAMALILSLDKLHLSNSSRSFIRPPNLAHPARTEYIDTSVIERLRARSDIHSNIVGVNPEQLGWRSTHLFPRN